METNDKMLKVLSDLIMCGSLTPAKTVTEDTLVCLVGTALDGSTHYRQIEFIQLPREMQHAIIDQPKGVKVGPWKVVGIFDIWEPDTSRAKVVKFAKN